MTVAIQSLNNTLAALRKSLDAQDGQGLPKTQQEADGGLQDQIGGERLSADEAKKALEFVKKMRDDKNKKPDQDDKNKKPDQDAASKSLTPPDGFVDAEPFLKDLFVGLNKGFSELRSEIVDTTIARGRVDAQTNVSVVKSLEQIGLAISEMSKSITDLQQKVNQIGSAPASLPQGQTNQQSAIMRSQNPASSNSSQGNAPSAPYQGGGSIGQVSPQMVLTALYKGFQEGKVGENDITIYETSLYDNNGIGQLAEHLIPVVKGYLGLQ